MLKTDWSFSPGQSQRIALNWNHNPVHLGIWWNKHRSLAKHGIVTCVDSYILIHMALSEIEYIKKKQIHWRILIDPIKWLCYTLGVDIISRQTHIRTLPGPLKIPVPALNVCHRQLVTPRPCLKRNHYVYPTQIKVTDQHLYCAFICIYVCVLYIINKYTYIYNICTYIYIYVYIYIYHYNIL